ncbi:hypothetical protein SAMN02910456_01453 [Ruminococcaceae bacterium YRB3002]|nr:hypothetical protein SAMN02910456_01453 [Ruminococcaceae bacterium YRB3002]
MDKQDNNILDTESLSGVTGGDIIQINPGSPSGPSQKEQEMNKFRCKKCGTVCSTAKHIYLKTCPLNDCGGKMELINR